MAELPIAMPALTPPLVGLPLGQARRLARKRAQATVEFKLVDSEEKALTVVRQYPEPGDELSESRVIKVEIATRPWINYLPGIYQDAEVVDPWPGGDLDLDHPRLRQLVPRLRVLAHHRQRLLLGVDQLELHRGLRALAREPPRLAQREPDQGRRQGRHGDGQLRHRRLPAVLDFDADQLRQLVLAQLHHLDPQPAALVDDDQIRDPI